MLKTPHCRRHFTTDRNNNLRLCAEVREEERKKEKKNCRGKARLSAKHEPLSTGAKVIPAFTIDLFSLSLFLFLSLPLFFF